VFLPTIAWPADTLRRGTSVAGRQPLWPNSGSPRQVLGHFRVAGPLGVKHSLMKASTRETRQCPLSNSGSKSFTKKCSSGGQISVTSNPRVSCSVICLSVTGTLVSCCINVRNVEISLLDVSLAALRLFLLAGVYIPMSIFLSICLYLYVYISILHTAVILMNMNSIFDVFCDCDVSET
jgi:hypothetical protein